VASYKSDDRRHDPELERGRENILQAFSDGRVRRRYGFDVEVPSDLKARLERDQSGDQLDAVLCAIQAAWAATQPRLGIPEECATEEGWIVDPTILERHLA
jgi:hypothetical protein